MIASRRQFLASLALPNWGLAAEPLAAFSYYGGGFQVDVRTGDPRVRSFDLRRLASLQTRADEFFIFHQEGAPPRIDLDRWRLEISGSVARPRTLTFADLKRASVQELAPLLRECGVLPEAREVVFFGSGVERERKWPAGEREMEVPHGRSIFVQDALAGDAMLATH